MSTASTLSPTSCGSLGTRVCSRERLVAMRQRIAQEHRAFGGDQFADLHALENLPVAVVLLADLDRPPGEAAAVGGDPDGHRAVAFAHDAVERDRRASAPAAPTRMTKFANMPERNSCCGSLISERTSTRRVFASTLAPIVVILPSNTRPGNAAKRDLHLLADAKRRTVGFGDFGQHPHGVDIGDGERRRRIAGLHEQPGRRIARRDRGR